MPAPGDRAWCQLKCGEALLNFAFNVHSRHYAWVWGRSQEVGRCKLKPAEIRVGSAWVEHLKLTHDELVAIFVFKFNVRRYYQGQLGLGDAGVTRGGRDVVTPTLVPLQVRLWV